MSSNGGNRRALRFVLLLGAVSLFGDMTYEAARSVIGPYMALLGASAAAVGTVAGLGEFIGYGFRIISGVFSDRTRRYWTITITGYVISLAAVPALALAGNWPLAAALMMAERFGKAVRNPARDAMLSHAAHGMGRGWAFGLHEAMDQTGAIIGPAIVAGVLVWKGSYTYGF
ncbi:MAG TPA: MFS transporter, partial [Thermodesulfobacteriota bacterium]|nr:MFS transporter [Thermodesulfobacteriota bacterium]